jgi:hypothetical protein
MGNGTVYSDTYRLRLRATKATLRSNVLSSVQELTGRRMQSPAGRRQFDESIAALEQR